MRVGAAGSGFNGGAGGGPNTGLGNSGGTSTSSDGTGGEGSGGGGSSSGGTGATGRLSAVRWGVTTKILYAWIFTLPGAALAALVLYGLLSRI